MNHSTTSSETSTPTRARNGTSPSPPDVNGTASTLAALELSGAPSVESPQPASPSSEIQSPFPRTTPRKDRPTSLYSHYIEEDEADDSSEDEAFGTPSEGLSEIEEEAEDGDAILAGTARKPASQPEALDAHNVDKGSRASEGDVVGTGPSTIRRTMAKSTKTKVQRRAVTSKSEALAVDQSKVLVEDIDTCRQVLTLFLTSKMKESEELCDAKNPEGNRMYLQNAHSIIEALKVDSAALIKSS